MFQIVENWSNRDVIAELSLEQFIETLSNPDLIRKQKVDFARKEGKGSVKYSKIKSSLPCVALNFNFDNYIKNDNAVKSTGFIYLDVDSDISTDFSEFDFVVACWKSVSNTGVGLIVSVDYVTTDNLKLAAFIISEELGIPYDNKAVSVDRLNVIGYDTNLYFNPKHTTYKVLLDTVKSNELVSFSSTINNIYRLQANDTSFESVRTSNLQELINSIDFNGEPYVDLGSSNKIKYASLYVPFSIKEGNRNSIMYPIASQIYGLNPSIKFDTLFSYCNSINKDKFKPQIEKTELFEIVRKVHEKSPCLNLNSEKRIVFNPNYNFTGKEKMSMSAKQINKHRAEMTYKEIVKVIEAWDFIEDGKISQSKIVKKTGRSLSTIKRHFHKVKEVIEVLNEENA